MSTETDTAVPGSNPDTVRRTADVRWPDPSPLQHWWTEIMDGALTPAFRCTRSAPGGTYRRITA